MKRIKVTVLSPSPFHLFNLSYQLQKDALLYSLITYYPKFYINKKYKIHSRNIKNLIFFYFLYIILQKSILYNFAKTNDLINQFMHISFSKISPFFISEKTDFFIGLSGFSLESINKCKRKKIISAVDYSALHPVSVNDQVSKHANKWGVPLNECYLNKDWLIKRQNLEFSNSDYIILSSEVSKNSFIAEGYNSSKLFVNNLSIKIENFKKIENIENERFRIIQVGTITILKGVLTLIQAFKNAKIKNSELLFVGPYKYGPVFNKLIINLSKNHAINFHKGVNKNKLNYLYNTSSVFVLASLCDGFGLVVAEAMSIGLPVIVTDSTGAADLINHGENGFIVKTDSEEEISYYLKLLYNDIELRKKIGRNAQLTISNKSLDKYGESYSDFIRQKLSQK